MEAMMSWWNTLAPLNQWFFVAAAFFSVFFIWQLIMAIAGIGIGHELDSQVEPQWDHATPSDADDTLQAFKLLSVRSILAFFTLFSWAGALYLNQHLSVTRSLAYALAWGLAAMAIVSLAFHLLRRMTESGNLRIADCVGKPATVYLDIAAGGEGEVRAICGTAMTHFRARAAGGAAIRAGTPVKVVRAIGPNIVEVSTDA